MISKILVGALNGIITFVVLTVIVLLLGMIGVAGIGLVLAPFIVVISVIVGVLTFLGYIPNYWPRVMS